MEIKRRIDVLRTILLATQEKPLESTNEKNFICRVDQFGKYNKITSEEVNEVLSMRLKDIISK